MKNKYLSSGITIVTVCLIALTYIMTAATAPTGIADSDELITTGALLGTAHPPGYGLNIILIHTAQKILFFLNPAHASHILAGFFQWLSLIICLRTITLIVRHEFPHISKSIAFFGIAVSAFSALFWRYAGTIEVASLGNDLPVYLFLVQYHGTMPRIQLEPSTSILQLCCLD